MERNLIKLLSFVVASLCDFSYGRSDKFAGYIDCLFFLNSKSNFTIVSRLIIECSNQVEDKLGRNDKEAWDLDGLRSAESETSGSV